MKTQLLLMSKSVLAVIMVFILLGCEKTDVIMDEEFIGTYNGSFTPNIANGLNSSKAIIPAVAEVIMIGSQIEVHCYGEGFDITLILDYFHDGNDVRVCFTGDDFEAMYGHSLGHGTTMHINGNQWMQHLNNEHEITDDHFGHFDLENHSFSYMFQWNQGDFLFNGIKN